MVLKHTPATNYYIHGHTADGDLTQASLQSSVPVEDIQSDHVYKVAL